MPLSDSENGKNVVFKNEVFEIPCFEKKHVINFKTEKEPEMKFFDFGSFQNKMQMLSHDNLSQ